MPDLTGQCDRTRKRPSPVHTREERERPHRIIARSAPAPATGPSGNASYGRPPVRRHPTGIAPSRRSVSPVPCGSGTAVLGCRNGRQSHWAGNLRPRPCAIPGWSACTRTALSASATRRTIPDNRRTAPVAGPWRLWRRVEGGTNAAHLGQAPAFGLDLRPLLAAQSDRRVMSSPEASHVGGQLDEDHAPETNGRMSVCRRCGARTDEAALHHVPDERQVDRSIGWLIAQVHRSRIERARKLHQDRIR
jgi:hypothetical protein